MRKDCRQFAPQSLGELKDVARRRSSSPVVWRARIVSVYAEGEHYRDLAERFGCSQQTIARWVKRFRASGIAGLQDHPRQTSGTGRCQKLLSIFLPETVHQSPRALGVAQDRWTLSALQEQCLKQTGERPSLETIRRALKRFGYSWKRAKRTVTSPDPDYEAKRGRCSIS
jgi:transposase